MRQSGRLTSQHKESHGVEGIFCSETKTHNSLVRRVALSVMKYLEAKYQGELPPLIEEVAPQCSASVSHACERCTSSPKALISAHPTGMFLTQQYHVTGSMYISIFSISA